jgi:spore coat-associated protein N
VRHSLSLLLAGGLVLIGVSLVGVQPQGPARAHPATRLVSGTLSMSNSRDGSAILTATGMGPGRQATGTVQIGNDGDLGGDFTLSKSNLSDSPGPLGGALSSRLLLSVQDVTGAPVTVYSGRLDGMGPVALGAMAPGAARTYRFTVTFPDGGAPDNAYRSSAASVQFDWTATSDGSTPPAGGGGDTPPSTGESPPGTGESPPSTGGTPSPSPTLPLLTVTAARTQRPLRQKAVVVKVSCRAACAIAATGRITGRGRSIKLTAARKSLGAGGSATLKLKLSRSALSAAKRALRGRGRMAAIVNITAKAAGVTSTAKRTIKLKR